MPLILALFPFSATVHAQTDLKVISWWQNTSDANALLGVTSIRLGCDETPAFCEAEIEPFADSQDVQRLYLSINLDPNTSATYAGQLSHWALTNPVLFSIGFDDFVGTMQNLKVLDGVSDPGAIVTDTVNAMRAANPNIKFDVTMYEDQLTSPLLGDSNLPASTRAGVDYVELYMHYRQDGANYAQYIQQVQALFPNAKIIAGVYAYDRIDYLPCSPNGVACTVQQEESLFNQLFQLQLSELQQGIVDQIEFFPGYFGLEDQWPGWTEARHCATGELQECISNTLAMRQMAFQDLTASFGPPGPLTSLSPRPLVFFVQNVSTSSGEYTVTLNNPGTGPLNVNSIAISGGNASDFSQRNSCPASLAAGVNCQINVTFTPSALGPRSSQLVVTDNARRSPHAMDLTGIGSNPTDPQVLLSPTTLNFQEQTVNTTSSRSQIFLSNPGGGDLAISSMTIVGASPPQFTQNNNCGSSVPAGGSCTINVTFTPTAAQDQGAELDIVDNAVGSPHTVTLLGIGNAQSAPQINLSTTVLFFASQNQGTQSGPQMVSVSNPGATAVTVTGVSTSGNNAGDFSQTNTCGTSLPAGQTCTVSITFDPTGSGPRSAQVLIADTANGTPQAITLNGTGVAPAAPTPGVSFSPTSLTFPSQNTGTPSPATTVTLTNPGTAALSITSIAISGANPGDFSETNTCAASVSAGASCTINVIFTPAAAGARSAQLTVTDNAAGSPQQVALSGTGATAATNPVATLSPTSLTFPSQTVNTPSAAQTVTLTNSGNATLTISSIAVAGANAADFAQTNTCSGSVAAGANCSISVVFTPAAAGARTAQLTVADNASGSPQQVALAGTGAAAASPDFALAVTPQSATLNPGQSGSFMLSVSGSNGFNQPVMFACSGLPTGASCNFSPASVTPSGNSAVNATLTVATTSGSIVFLRMLRVDWPVFLESLATLAAFGLFLLLYRRRPLYVRRVHGIPKFALPQPSLAFLLILFLALAAVVGCGGGSSATPPPTTGGTPAGTYSITVTASSGTLSHKAVVSLTVN